MIFKFSYKFLNRLAFIALIFTFLACSDVQIKDSTPEFNSEQAYQYIEKQVNFGNRNPGSNGHKACFDYLVSKLKSLTDFVYVQETVLERYDSKKIPIKNIIAQFYPEKEIRLLLYTHYDTRFIADNETDSTLILKGVPGANDGASGTAVLLEIANIVKKTEPDIGIDIILFDAEDQGPKINESLTDLKYWCLGSQYWVNNKVPENYDAKYGICIDLVGLKNTTFMLESHSRHYASYFQKKIWTIAEKSGYEAYFTQNFMGPSFNDHMYVSQEGGIRSLIITGYTYSENYGKHWHTTKDDLKDIDKNTLEAVGQTLVNVIFNYF